MARQRIASQAGKDRRVKKNCSGMIQTESSRLLFENWPKKWSGLAAKIKQPYSLILKHEKMFGEIADLCFDP
jgi:hypothetical protein